jgi:hypothetical protein
MSRSSRGAGNVATDTSRTNLLYILLQESRNKDIKHMTRKILAAITKPEEVLEIMTRW